MTKEEQLAKALMTLETYVRNLALAAGKTEAYAEKLWGKIRNSSGVLKELSYFHDYGNFLCKYRVAGYTLADILVWQVDHFKAYLDRREEVNRFERERLLLAALDIMVQMEENPAPFVEKMQRETGTDYEGKY